MSATKFDRAVAIVLKHEGGFVNRASDPGGATNFGVSLRWLQSIGTLEGDFDGDGDVDAQDIAMMSVADAKAIYKKHWWDSYGYEALPEASGTKVFDCAVNMGAHRAHLLAQRACIVLGKPITADGKLGPKTRAAIVACGDGFLPRMRIEMANFYRDLARRKPTMQEYLKGWLRRAAA